jgi:uncharacterized protein (UPF0147 family)
MVRETKKQIIYKNIVLEIKKEAQYLLEDDTIPKNVHYAIRNINDKLNDTLCSVEVSTILYELEDTINNTNSSDCRSIVWGLISKLETLKEKMK